MNQIKYSLSKIKEFLTSEKLGNGFQIIKQNGGLVNGLKTLYYTDDLKWGRLVGEDHLGNKYYENNYYFFGRNRWVIYNRSFGLNYDGSLVPPEWCSWLHNKTDYTPCEDPGRPKYKWMEKHTENLSGTNQQYVPYSTPGKEKIEPWIPPPKVRCKC